MKKLFALLILTLAFAVPTFAQVSDGTTPTTIDFGAYFIDLTTLAATVMLLTSLVNKWFKAEGHALQYVSFGVALVAAAGAKFFGFGMFISLGWVWTMLYGIASGLLANGIYDINFIQGILELIGLKVPKDK